MRNASYFAVSPSTIRGWTGQGGDGRPMSSAKCDDGRQDGLERAASLREKGQGLAEGLQQPADL